MQRSVSPRTTRLIALLITAIGFALRLYSLASESLWYDELLQVNLALADIPSLLYRLPFHTALPLDYLISHYWIFGGKSDAWVRIPAVVAGTLTLPLAFQLGRRLLGDLPGLLFMALLAYAPFHVHYSQEVRPYALGLLGITLADYLLWRIRATGEWHYLLPLQGAVLIFALSHYFALSIFGPFLIFLVLDVLFNAARQNSLKALMALLITGFVALLVLLALGWGPTLLNVSSRFSQTLAEPEQFTADPSQKPNQGTGPIINRDFIEKMILGPIGAGRGKSLWLMNGLVIGGLVSLVAQKKYKQSLLLGLWVVAPVVGIVAFLVHRGTFFAPRYILFILPAYFMLIAMGVLALPHLVGRFGPAWLAVGAFLLVGWFVFSDLNSDLLRLYRNKDKEDWHLVGDFIANNAGPNDAVIAVKAEPTMNWYYPPATTAGNRFDNLAEIKRTVAQAERSWIILSIFSSGIDTNIKAWLSDSEQGSVRFVLDPIITVYYLGHQVDKEQLLTEVRDFVLPVDHAIYASLARENRRHPDIARRYYELAIEHAPDAETRASYQTALAALE